MRLQHLALLPLGVSLRGEKTCLNKLSGWDAWDVSCKGYEGKGDVESHGTKAVFHLTLILRLTQGNGVNIEKYQKRRFGLFVLVLQPPATTRNISPETENHGVPGSSPGPATSIF